MDQNKIKDCFNSVNIPVLPSCDELLTPWHVTVQSTRSGSFSVSLKL